MPRIIDLASRQDIGVEVGAKAAADCARACREYVATAGPTVISAAIVAIAKRLPPAEVADLVKDLIGRETPLPTLDEIGTDADRALAADTVAPEDMARELTLALPAAQRHRVIVELVALFSGLRPVVS